MTDADDRAISIVRMDDVPWTGSGLNGVVQQEIRYDTVEGHYFGAAKFSPLARSGIHRHVGPAVSYMIYGALYDHDSEVRAGQAYINLSGAVHDVVTYEACLAITRLDGPVLYPGDEGIYYRLRDAADEQERIDDTVGLKPNLYVTVEDVAAVPTGLPWVSRRMIYDYARDAWNARFVQLLLEPGARIPAHRTTDRVDWFVLAGETVVGNRTAPSASYVSFEPGARAAIESPYGCRILAWADGPVAWEGEPGRADLYGF